jgi:hypothetical protein
VCQCNVCLCFVQLRICLSLKNTYTLPIYGVAVFYDVPLAFDDTQSVVFYRHAAIFMVLLVDCFV